MKNKIVIIGGGASGLMAAIVAAREQSDVTILEHTDRVGKKILSTGNGRCNLTNTDQDIGNYYCADSNFVKDILNQFSYKDTLDFFSKMGVYFKNRDGYIYPYSNQASSILEILILECNKLGVHIIYNITVKKITLIKNGDMGFQIQTENSKVLCDRLIIATGSKAAPKTGSDGSGYDILKKMGHHIIKPLPALVGLRCENKCSKALAGVRTEGTISLYINDTYVAENTGEIQLTDYGISGIPVFQVSRIASIALSEGKSVKALIDFFPDQNLDMLTQKFIDQIKYYPKRTIAEQFIGILNKKLATVIIKEAGFSLNRESVSLNQVEIKRLVDQIKYFEFIAVSTNSYEQAQVCCGGVSVQEVTGHTLESKLINNLYIIGEVLDVDGICGGYNLQWAWSTGYVAGKHVGEQSVKRNSKA